MSNWTKNQPLSVVFWLPSNRAPAPDGQRCRRGCNINDAGETKADGETTCPEGKTQKHWGRLQDDVRSKSVAVDRVNLKLN